MTSLPPSEGPHPAGTGLGLWPLWALAVGVAALGAWTLFDAEPGLNWTLWTAAAVAGLTVVRRARGGAPGVPLLLGVVPVLLAGAALQTASEELAALVALSVALWLSVQCLSLAANSLAALTARAVALAPLQAARLAVLETLARVREALLGIRSHRARAWVRGLLLTGPVLVAFALLFAEADPLFARWRDTVAGWVADWTFVPRTLFFGALLVVVLGAYGRAHTPRHWAPAPTPRAAWLGATERQLLMGSVAALCWLFLLLQVGYLFGNAPATPASGVTFAEYARKGFAELAVVATAAALLIGLTEQLGTPAGRTRAVRGATLALLAAVLCLVASAFRRVLLYEAAYGYTTARLFAQLYMTGVAAGLLLLAREVLGAAFDVDRLARRALVVATVLMGALLYGRPEAWIAGRNLERFARTGQLDVRYLADVLSLDAVPTIARHISALPDAERDALRGALVARHAKRRAERPVAWYEFNLARRRGWRALDQLSSPTPPAPVAASVGR